ncbi:hypothetical protein Tco_0718185 [Tanacetum coccineum]
MGTCSSFLFANKATLMLFVEAVSTLKKGRDLLAPYDRKRLRAAIFPLRLYISLSVFGCSTLVIDFTFEGLARIPCLVMRCPKNGPSSTPKEHFFRFNFMLIDQNFSNVSLISANISSSDRSLGRKAFFSNRRPLLLRRKSSYPHLLLPFGSSDNLYRRPRNISVGALREILPSSQFEVEGSSL